MKFRLIVDKSKEEEVVATVHSPCQLTEQIEQLVMAHNGTDRICAYTEDSVKYLPFSQIECITVLGGKTYAIDTNGFHYRLKQRLYELEPLLPSSFIRINKSSFANESRLDRFCVTYSGAVDALFRCGYREYVSRRCFRQIKRRFDNK